MSRTRTTHATLRVHLEGGLLVAGGAGDGRRAITATDADGRPIVPGSTLKGVVRHAYERLFGAATSAALFGAPGVEPHDPGTPAKPADPSPASRLFVGDAHAESDDAPLVDKPQVAIDPDTGRARDGRFFVRRTVAPFAGLCFAAPLQLVGVDEEEERRLDAAIASVFALGAGRSAGLGQVRLERVPADGSPAPRPRIESVPESTPGAGSEGGEWLVDLVAEEPLNLGTARLLGNYFPSRHHVPASTLRGAVITAALRQRGITSDQRLDPDFRRLVLDPETCLRFGDAWPVETEDESDAVPHPPARTARRCKHDAAHPPRDVLLPGYLRLLAARHAAGEGSHAGLGTTCAECGAPLRARERAVGAAAPIRTYRTRVRMDRATGRALDHHLFALELIAPGTRFRARLGAVDAEGHRLLVDAAAAGLFVGQGRGQGYGRMRMASLRPAPVGRSLDDRLEAFDARVREGVEGLARALDTSPEALGAPRHHVAVTLRSPLVLAPDGNGLGDVPLEERMLDALGLDADLGAGDMRALDSHLRPDERRGWDSLEHHPKAVEPAIAAGSVLLLGTDAPLDALAERLRALEARGAGRRREEGFGWLVVGDPAEGGDHA